MLVTTRYAAQCVLPLSTDSFRTKVYKTCALLISAIGAVYGIRLTRIPASFAQGVGVILGSLLTVAVSAVKAHVDYNRFTPVGAPLTNDELTQADYSKVTEFSSKDFQTRVSPEKRSDLSAWSEAIKGPVTIQLKHMFSDCINPTVESPDPMVLMVEYPDKRKSIATYWKVICDQKIDDDNSFNYKLTYNFNCKTEIDSLGNAHFSLAPNGWHNALVDFGSMCTLLGSVSPNQMRSITYSLLIELNTLSNAPYIIFGFVLDFQGKLSKATFLKTDQFIYLSSDNSKIAKYEISQFDNDRHLVKLTGVPNIDTNESYRLPNDKDKAIATLPTYNNLVLTIRDPNQSSIRDLLTEALIPKNLRNELRLELNAEFGLWLEVFDGQKHVFDLGYTELTDAHDFSTENDTPKFTKKIRINIYQPSNEDHS